MKNFTLRALVISLMLATAATHAENRRPATKEKPLAERLGGYKAIQAVVDEFVANVEKDARINRFFANTDMTHLRKMLTDQLCAAGGGWVDAKHKKKCVYTGKEMKPAHAGMGVQEADFDALLENLAKALSKFKVPAKDKAELLAVLSGLKNDVVEARPVPAATPTPTATQP